MPRNRVLSFMSTWGNGQRSPSPPDVVSGADRVTPSTSPAPNTNLLRKAPPSDLDLSASQSASQLLDANLNDSPSSPGMQSRARGDYKPKRLSMRQSYVPPQVEVANDTPPELQPIFTYLNSHSNKLYQEGYFLKLHDLDTRGRPSADRIWTECFAQLIGTVLSLWDAAALDVAGEDAEVVPTFINLSDAAIKMIESLPMNGARGGNLQNVLSISTAANNRYLLHFNTLNSLTQWTAGIRLAMFEHSMLQEAYTGSLIAGKGRHLNNIKQIMFRLKFAHEDWARVRFGAGTPWQRCWCVISPPDEKEWEKAQKIAKKAGPYEKIRYPKGNIKFYSSRKVNKKTLPLATVTEAYAAYAIYPQSKPLVEQSTLVKVEGMVTMHDGKGATQEGFVFVMPEVHQAVSGFEMMLRWLFPTFDAFQLYGRPQKLIADTLDQRGLMFAMPTSRRYGHLDILDVSGLIHTKGSQGWTERQWRRELKKLTSDRMMAQVEGQPRASVQVDRRRNTTNDRLGVRFGNEGAQSTPGSRSTSPPEPEAFAPPRTDSAPPNVLDNSKLAHKRSTSEAQGYRKYMSQSRSRLSEDPAWADIQEIEPVAPAPPQHTINLGRPFNPGSLERIQSGSQVPTLTTMGAAQERPDVPLHLSPVEPVGPPPAFTHQANSRPVNRPSAPPELRRANSNVDAETLAEMKDATSPQSYYNGDEESWQGLIQHRQQHQLQDTVASQPSSFAPGSVPADRSQGAVNRMQPPGRGRDPRQRLSTIPGSPYIGDGSESIVSPSPVTENPMPTRAAPPPPLPPPPPPKDESPDAVAAGPLRGAHSIARKPLPRALPNPMITLDRPSVLQRSHTDPTNAPLGESWENIIINETALDQQLNGAERANTLQTIATTESSEPDCASTAASSPKKSMERHRAGQLRSVGNPELPATNAYNLPEVDFGRTFDYTETVGSSQLTRPSVPPRALADKRRSRSADRLLEMSREASNGGYSLFNSAHSTPVDSRRHSYVEPDSAPLAPPSTIQATPQAQLTPDQWAQQRALLARQSQQQLNHQGPTPENVLTGRSNSAITGRRKLTKENPISRVNSAPRVPSGDWSSSIPQPPRPSSRGAGINFDTAGRSLSATEQMQVSRATGSPLVDLSQGLNNQQHLPEIQPGLVSAVAQRERDKAASREGRNSVFLQQAIERERRQQQEKAQQQQQRFHGSQMPAMSMSMMQPQQQSYAHGTQYGIWTPQHQQRPSVQQQSRLWQGGAQQGQGQVQQPPMEYYAPSQPAVQQYGNAPAAGYYAPGQAGGQYAEQQYGQQQQRPQQPMAPYQAYGSSYMAQQQQQQQQQNQQQYQQQPYGRR